MKIPFNYLPQEFKNINSIISKWKLLSKSTEFTLGPVVKKFENRFAKYIGSKYCISTNNGTESLILCLKALGVKYGDEVITVSNTFYATAGAIVACSATPIFVDCDSRYQINIEQIEKKITKMQQTGDLGLGIIGADGTGTVVCGENNFPVLTLKLHPASTPGT